jgi:hypothetical protein
MYLGAYFMTAAPHRPQMADEAGSPRFDLAAIALIDWIVSAERLAFLL